MVPSHPGALMLSSTWVAWHHGDGQSCAPRRARLMLPPLRRPPRRRGALMLSSTWVAWHHGDFQDHWSTLPFWVSAPTFLESRSLAKWRTALHSTLLYPAK